MLLVRRSAGPLFYLPIFQLHQLIFEVTLAPLGRYRTWKIKFLKEPFCRCNGGYPLKDFLHFAKSHLAGRKFTELADVRFNALRLAVCPGFLGESDSGSTHPTLLCFALLLHGLIAFLALILSIKSTRPVNLNGTRMTGHSS